MTVPVITDSFGRSEDITHRLGGVMEAKFHAPDRLPGVAPGQFVIVDINLKDGTHLPALRDWLSRGPKDHRAIFVVNRNSRIEEVRAYATGATGLIHRPIDVKALLVKLWGDFMSLTDNQLEFAAQSTAGVAAAHSGLQNIFACACLGEPLNLKMVDSAGAAVVDQIEDRGLSNWVDAVRKHHSQTYQHCLLVTGVAVTFGQNLGFGSEDRKRLASAGMLHDIGKARIPVAILEKPGRLDDDEMATMRHHPEYGYDALRAVPDLEPDMLDIVVHHHEYLDGSGYPHGIGGSEISDFVRVMTISDIFGALIERRAYRAPMPSDRAYGILKDMGAKLDKDLVREFGFMAQLGLQAA